MFFSIYLLCCCFEFESMAVHGKRRLRSLFWRVRAYMKRQMKKRACSSKTNFNYDPLSYSLNFDDGKFLFFCSTQLVISHHNWWRFAGSEVFSLVFFLGCPCDLCFMVYVSDGRTWMLVALSFRYFLCSE